LQVRGDVESERREILCDPLPHFANLGVRPVWRGGVKAAPAGMRPLFTVEVEVDDADSTRQALQRHDPVLVTRDARIDRVVSREFGSLDLRRGGGELRAESIVHRVQREHGAGR
jgi:hypothetical protein